MVVKIVRKVVDKFFSYGIDGKGGVFVLCKKCGITMNLIDLKFDRKAKTYKFYCRKCKVVKIVKNNLF